MFVICVAPCLEVPDEDAISEEAVQKDIQRENRLLLVFLLCLVFGVIFIG